MQKVSSIEYDFTQHYDKQAQTNGLVNGGHQSQDQSEDVAAPVQLEV